MRRGTLCILPLFARHLTKIEALLVCSGLPVKASAKDEHKTLFDLLVQEVMPGVAPRPKWDDLEAAIARTPPAGSRDAIEAAMCATVEEALALTRGNVAGTARRLGVPLRTLWNYIQRHQIDTARFRTRLA